MGDMPAMVDMPAMGDMPASSSTKPASLPLFQPLRAFPSYPLIPPHASYPMMPQYQLSRFHRIGKRGAEEGVEEFINNWSDFTDGMHYQLSNLTCIFKKMGMLTSAGKINIGLYQQTFWDNINVGATLAGSDPAWRSMLVTRWTDCYNMANALPAETLTRIPLMKDVQMMRNMKFWKCALTVKTECCAAAQQYDTLTEVYGEDDGSVNWAQYGLPSDKYDLASLASMVLAESASPLENLVASFFRSDGSDM